jgi:hypothetical protein
MIFHGLEVARGWSNLAILWPGFAALPLTGRAAAFIIQPLNIEVQWAYYPKIIVI